MDLPGKFQPVIIIAAALLGLLLGAATPFGTVSSGLISFFLMLLLYILFLSIDLNQIKKSFSNIRFTAAAVALNFIFTPVFGGALGFLFFPESPDIRIGLLMLLVTPCTDWYLVFTGLSKGNVALGMSILPLNLILQIALLPVYLFLLTGSDVSMNIGSVLGSIVIVLMIPFALSCLTKRVAKASYQSFLSSWGDRLQLLFLCLAVVAMFASEGENLIENYLLLAEMFVPLLIFFAVLLAVSQAVGKAMKFPKKDIIALSFTTLARNSPLSLAIAVVTFPDNPLISLALVIGPLIELPALAVISQILKDRTKPVSSQ